jgi:hypothetical protein
MRFITFLGRFDTMILTTDYSVYLILEIRLTTDATSQQGMILPQVFPGVHVSKIFFHGLFPLPDLDTDFDCILFRLPSLDTQNVTTDFCV